MNFEQLYCLWGKKSSLGEQLWLPLMMHLADTAAVGALLWDRWLSSGVKRNIASNMLFNRSEDACAEKEASARSLFIFLCAAHDLGKATPAFQSKDARISYAGTSEQCERDERDDACKDLDEAIFTRLKRVGFLCPEEIPNRMKTPHAMCSQVLLTEIAGKGVKNIAAILGAHHGKPQDSEPDGSDSWPLNYYGSKNKEYWKDAQRALCDWALRLSGFDSYEHLPVPNQVAAVEVCGLLIMADWISSNDYLFPYIHLDDEFDIAKSRTRAVRGFEKLGLTHRWQPLDDLGFSSSVGQYYRQRFEFDAPNALQKKIIEIARNQSEPGIMVIEAPMGYGKTETALAAAEILAERSGRTGVFFALPTQATSNGIFPRLESWVRHFNDSRCHSIELFHCRAEFNDDWKAIKEADEFAQTKSEYGNGRNSEDENDDTLIVNDWFSGRKKSMLADFVVGTVDQLLMGAFKQKHVMLRHLGLANKVVIIDECHAYDAYMSVYLHRILEWLGKYGVPTIVLSATLTSDKRREFIELYTGCKACLSKEEAELYDVEQIQKPEWITSRAYPLVTYSNKKDEVCSEVIPSDDYQTTIDIEKLCDENIEIKLAELMKNGGCAGIIVNSVRRAQAFSRRMREIYGDDKVVLFHSRFLMPDRAEIEKNIKEMLGKPSEKTHRPDFKIVIGTQVLEQSLDIDFDVLFTDLAPMDLLIQRMGRLHRHHRSRPELLKTPKCFVLGCEGDGRRASKTIYGNYLLMRTEALLPNQMVLPDDISQYVEDTYRENTVISGIDAEAYQKAYKQYQDGMDRKRDRARAFRISAPNIGKRRSTLEGWLSRDGGDADERAAVRDISESIEVSFVQELDDGCLHLMDENQTSVSRNETPSDETAREILKYSLELPLGATSNLENTITALEHCAENVSRWQKSRWLKGNLFIILDKTGHFNGLSDFELIYSKSEGLSYIKKEQPNA